MKRPKSDEPAPDFLEDQRAGDLQIGSYSHSWLYDRDRKVTPRTIEFGFRYIPAPPPRPTIKEDE